MLSAEDDEQHRHAKRPKHSGRIRIPSVPDSRKADNDNTDSGAVETIDLTHEQQHNHVEKLPDAPIHLLRVRGIADWANQGLASARLGDLVAGTIRWALVSNYMIDLAWLFSACPSLCKVRDGMVVVHGEPPSHVAAMQHTVQSSGLQAKVTFHLPPLPPYGTHHTKAFLLQYDTGLRVIVFTANAIYPDCNNKSQALFFQDFPLKDECSPSTSTFEKDLLEYVVELKFKVPMMQSIVNKIKLHDFSAARVCLVASVPSGFQPFTGNRISSFGHLKLRKLLEEESVVGSGFHSTFQRSPILAQFSSLGNMSSKWLDSFLDSLSAGHVVVAMEEEKKEEVSLGLPRSSSLQIIWPTVSEVQNSIEGWFAGRSIPGQPDKVGKNVLKGHFHRWSGSVGGRQRAMPHMKSYTRYDPMTKELAWVCITSHNLSKAAWGEQQIASKTKRQQFKILSYELGVLCLPSTELAYRRSRWYGFSCTHGGDAQCSTSTSTPPAPMPAAQRATSLVFVQWQRGMTHSAWLEELESQSRLVVPVPLPYQLPPPAYGPSDVPWDTRAGMAGWDGIDSWGLPFPGQGAHYGLLDDQEWREAVL